MRARLMTLLAVHRGSAELQVANNLRLEVDRAEVDAATLPDVFVRRLVENAALVHVAAAGGEIVNGKRFPPTELWPL